MVDKIRSNTNPILNTSMDRREAIERSLRFGAGLVLIGMLPPSLSGCAVEDALEPSAVGNTGLVGMSLTPAPDAEILLAPYKAGDLLDEQYKLVAIERAQDKHLRICLVDVKHGGKMEIELFRHASASLPRTRISSPGSGNLAGFLMATIRPMTVESTFSLPWMATTASL